MKKLLIFSLAVIIIAGGAVGGYVRSLKAPEPEVSTVTIDRGDIVQVVAATGTVEAMRTVEVATQVNGVILEKYADFNSIVTKGQKIAKIDPRTIEATIESDKANLEGARANLERQKVTLEDSMNKLRRAQGLFDKRLMTRQDLEAAQVAEKTNRASLKAQEASIRQTEAKLNQDLVSLSYTDIFAPVSGIIINRKVDVGQTVVSTNQATSMFQIAEDLTKMQLKVNVDESDVGMLRPGQRAIFTVDAFLDKEFTGSVSQVRLQPVITQNVVTYITIIEVANPYLELKPGMTANVRIETARRENVLRIPVSALRFRATPEVFQMLELPASAEAQRNGAPGPSPSGQRVSADGRIVHPDAAASLAGDTRQRANIAERGATTIDALFGDLLFDVTAGRVWTYAQHPTTKARLLKPIEVHTGISDGTYAELLRGNGLEEGKLLLTSVMMPQRTTTPAGSGNPLMPGGRRPGDHGPGGWGGPH